MLRISCCRTQTEAVALRSSHPTALLVSELLSEEALCKIAALHVSEESSAGSPAFDSTTKRSNRDAHHPLSLRKLVSMQPQHKSRVLDEHAAQLINQVQHDTSASNNRFQLEGIRVENQLGAFQLQSSQQQSLEHASPT